MLKRSSIAPLFCLSLVLIARGETGPVIPRAEFPNPQFERAEWQTLNGNWSFRFDDEDAGLSRRWFAGPLPDARSITVPYCFESKLSGIGDTSLHGPIWYSRTFLAPRAWSGKHVLLHFGAVYYQASVWLNGQHLGDHTGGNVPFEWDITLQLRAGRNVLTLRADNPATDRSIPRGKQYWKAKSAEIFYTRTSGIWQPVWLEATGANHLDAIHITAGADGTVHLEGFLAARSTKPLTVRLELSRNETTAGTVELRTTEDRFFGQIQVANPALWAPGSPVLYDVKLTLLQQGVTLDTVHSYLGFRSIAISGNRVTINGQPVYLKFLLDQGYWPDSILTPPSDAAIQRDIDLIQSMGFNGVRKHQKVADPRFLYWADRRGVLVSGEIADAYEFNDEEVQRFSAEWISAVRRDINHPSIIIWNAINESWGVPDLQQKNQRAFLIALYQMTRTLDDSRLVIDNEGWQHASDTDLYAIHDYQASGDKLFERYKNVGGPDSSVPPNARPATLEGYRYNGAPLYLSEFGGIAYIPREAKVPAESWGYSGVEKTEDAALARLTQLYAGVAKLKNLAGICYTQLTDVEQEVNGLATYDRQPKFPPEKVKALNDQLQ